MVRPVLDALPGIRDKIRDDYQKSLESPENLDTFIPTYCPNESRKHGRALALDLGGTNFRLAIISSGEEVKQTKYIAHPIPGQTRNDGNGKALFEWMAEMTSDFLHEEGEVYLDVGLTWSYSLKMTAIDRGEILHLGKGFSTRGLYGKDLKALLEEAWQERGLTKLSLKAIINDGVAAFLAGKAKVTAEIEGSVILATGTNACWPVQCATLKRLRVPQSTPSMLINVEWGSVGREWILDLLGEEVDKTVDMTSGHPGFEPLEYFVGGRYVGELARLECQSYLRQHGFNDEALGKLQTPWTLTAEHCAKVESGQGNSLFPSLSQYDADCLTSLVTSISTRSAHLLSAALAALISLFPEEGQRSCNLAIEGSFIEHYPNYLHRVREGLRVLLPPRTVDKIHFVRVGPGALIGAGLAALSV